VAIPSAKPSEICCDWLEARLVAIVLGGTAASHTCSGVGGGHFLIKKSDRTYRAALWDRTNNAVLLPLTLYMEVSLVMLATLDLVTLDVTARADVGCHHTALGVFFRFQVADFDRLLGFFSLCHFIFPSYLFWVVCRCVVSVTPKGN
jgi:hypothetical protein